MQSTSGFVDKRRCCATCAWLAIAAVQITYLHQASGQTFSAVRIDGRPAGTLFDSGGSDPIIDVSTFTNFGVGSSESNDINGPSVLRLPDWLPVSERVDPAANYYMFFAHHDGDSIRLAWAETLTSEWNLFNMGGAPSRSWGVGGGNTGSSTPGNGVLDLDLQTGGNGIVSNDNELYIGGGGRDPIFAVNDHIASPDVLLDHENERFVMYFHGPNAGSGPSDVQQTYVATSSNGLNFNMPGEGGQTGHGVREVIPAEFYARTFEVGGTTFAYTNLAELFRAPTLNDAGEVNTIANGDSEGGLWNPTGTPNLADHWWEQMPTASNPIERLYQENGQGIDDVRHFAVYSRQHRDVADTNLYVFYTARYDTPESVFLSVINTNNGSTDPATWEAIGQRLILEPELDWEGADQPLAASKNGRQTNVRQLRDPYVFEDSLGTANLNDDRLYLFYSGEGEEAIGFAELFFDPITLNTAGPQGDLFPESLTLYVNPNNGGQAAIGHLPVFVDPLEIISYTIRSQNGELIPANFVGIASDVELGDDWFHSESNINPNRLTELMLSDDGLTFEAGRLVEIGAIFNAVGQQDLAFEIQLSTGEIIEGKVKYGSIPGYLPGDFNDDGMVNLGDYTVWRDNLGASEAVLNGNGNQMAASANVVDLADYALWKEHFGTFSAGSLQSSPISLIPEPTSTLLLLGGLAHLFAMRAVLREVGSDT